jgi:hypothetical protein
MDYSKVVPGDGTIYTTEAVHLSHAMFLGPQEDMDAVRYRKGRRAALRERALAAPPGSSAVL